MNYYNSISKELKSYFDILEPNFPSWLSEYINTKELLTQKYVSTTCGIIYSNLFESNYFYSSLDHSVAVALIIWHFTKDKKQTIAGLFHDIATPAFKHCIDFLNKDYMHQESTEELTTSMIKKSNDVLELLKRDNIKLEEIDNYHIYPIADNDTPMLSADRLEYTFINSLFTYNLLDLETIKKIYNDIEIQKNEYNINELGFKTKGLARMFVKASSKQSIHFLEDRTRYSMQFIADIIKRLIDDKLISFDDLYDFKEEEIINIIEKSKYSDIFNIWKNAKKVKASKTKVDGVYNVHLKAKIRYINPLINGKRIYDECKIAKKMIGNNLAYEQNNYVYLNEINDF
jgi:hypothetical protein